MAVRENRFFTDERGRLRLKREGGEVSVVRSQFSVGMTEAFPSSNGQLTTDYWLLLYASSRSFSSFRCVSFAVGPMRSVMSTPLR